jgi:hypothetical protein
MEKFQIHFGDSVNSEPDDFHFFGALEVLTSLESDLQQMRT